MLHQSQITVKKNTKEKILIMALQAALQEAWVELLSDSREEVQRRTRSFFIHWTFDHYLFGPLLLAWIFRKKYPGDIRNVIEKFVIKVTRSGIDALLQVPRLDLNELSNTISDG